MHCQRQGHKKHEPGLEVESAGATKSNNYLFMRRVADSNLSLYAEYVRVTVGFRSN
jgi:hypothetical protein